MAVGQHPLADPLNPPKPEVKHIWKTFGILVAVTAVEFMFAFGMSNGGMKTSIFILLTIVKAYFIVSEFMHLGHEKKALVYSVISPMIFIVWLLVALLIDALHYFDSLRNYFESYI